MRTESGAGILTVCTGNIRRSPAVACAGTLALVYVAAVLTPWGQVVDEWVFGRIQVLGPGPLAAWWPLLARRVIPFAVVVVVVVLAVAALRHRPVRVVAAVVLVGISTGLSLVLKELLPRPTFGRELGYLDNTFPSTHVTATTALLAAVWLLAPRSPVRLARLLVVAAVVVGIGNVVGHAHRPSDVLGSVLLVGLVTGVVHLAMGRGGSGYADDATRERSAAGRRRSTGKDGWA